MSYQSFSYRTLQGESESLLKDRGSKFLGYSRAVTSENEVDSFLNEIKSIHPKASHHCYAWRIGNPEPVERANDDGEPSSTAGRPILGQLIKSDITNAMIIVVRYFGGTLLGTSGLIQAYKACAETVLDNSQIITVVEKETWLIEVDYAIVHILEEWAPQLGFEILEREHQAKRMNYRVEIGKRKSLKARRELIAMLLDCYPEEVEEGGVEYELFSMKQVR